MFDRRPILTYIFCVSLALPVLSQSIEWQTSIGGTDLDEAYSIQQINDGGYILTGKTKSTDGDITCNSGEQDAIVIKLNATGEIEWQQCLVDSLFSVGFTIQQIMEGGYIVAGSVDAGSSTDVIVTKLDEDGNIVWRKFFGGSAGETAYSIVQSDDGGYVFAGESESNDGDVIGNKGLFDIWMVKLDTAGHIEWQKTIGGSQDDRANAIRKTLDGGYVIGGQTFSDDGDASGLAGVNDFWIVKLDSVGNIEWQNTLGGQLFDEAMTIETTTDGGFLAAGYTYSNDGDVTVSYGNQDAWITKLNSEGELQWQKTFGGSMDDIMFAVDETDDGGFIIAGGSSSTDGDITGNKGKWDFWVLKIDDEGQLQWQQSFGGSNFDVAYSIDHTSDAGFVMTGYSNSVDGDVTDPHGNRDIWVVKLAAMTPVHENENRNSVFIYPNPVSSILHFKSVDVLWDKIEIVNLNGRVIYSAKEPKQIINVSNWDAGIYFLRIANQNEVHQGRFVIDR